MIMIQRGTTHKRSGRGSRARDTRPVPHDRDVNVFAAVLIQGKGAHGHVIALAAFQISASVCWG